MVFTCRLQICALVMDVSVLSMLHQRDIWLFLYILPHSRMSPTEFSNYIKQRAIQQQNHHPHSGHSAITPVNNGATVQAPNSHMNSIGPVSPARSISPNPLSIAIINNATTTNSNSISGRTILPNDSYYYGSTTAIASNGTPNINTPIAATSMYSPQPQFGRSNLFDTNNSFGTAPPQNAANNLATNSSFYSNGYGSVGNAAVNATTATSAGKYSPYIDAGNYYGLQSGQQQQPANTLSSLGAPASHLNGMTNGHHQTLETNLNTGNINLLVAN